MTVDEWLLTVNAGREPDPDGRGVLRTSPVMLGALMRASSEGAVYRPGGEPDPYYDTAPRFGHVEVIVDYRFPAGGWALEAEAGEVLAVGVLDPPRFDPPPIDQILGFCLGCGQPSRYGHTC